MSSFRATFKDTYYWLTSTLIKLTKYVKENHMYCAYISYNSIENLSLCYFTVNAPRFIQELCVSVCVRWIIHYQSSIKSSWVFFLFQETIQELLELEDRIWIVILQETLVYLIVFVRWVLPRVDLSRMALSDLLLDYFGKASDIMELYALFDEDAVRTNLTVTYFILATWSFSFLQFVPVLVHKHKYRHLHNVRLRCISPAFTDHFPEVFDTCMTFFLQDGPFLCLRLYVMLELDLLTYSLVFFVLKNIFTLILLVYRFTILCCRSPYRSCGICRNKTNKQLGDNNYVNETDKNELKEKERQTNVPDQIFYFD